MQSLLKYPTLLLGFLECILAYKPHASIFDESSFDPSSIITRDVAIIGGGSTGTYSAIRLQDAGKSIVLIESKPRLGGHTQTYLDPITNLTTDYGVLVFHATDLVKAHFARFNIPLSPFSFDNPGGVIYNVDLDTNTVRTDIIPEDPTPGIAAYAEQLAKYPYLEKGFYLPYPVPEDLTLPFGKFAEKYNISPTAVYYISNIGQGLGDIANLPTLYVFQNSSPTTLRSVATSFLTTTRNDNSELYAKSHQQLGAENVYLSSRILATTRIDALGEGYAKLILQTGDGERKLIRAKRILITTPPKVELLQPWFDLTRDERNVFSTFRNTGYYSAVLRNTGIPDDTTIANRAFDEPFDLPKLPGPYLYSPNSAGIPGLHVCFYGAEVPRPDEEVKRDIIGTLRRLRIPGLELGGAVEMVAYASHVPFELHVGKRDIDGGFYKRLYGLQGKRGTWWTGGAWFTHDSSLLWGFSEDIVQRIVQDLE